ncbi:3-oxoacyl-ACP reductase [Polyangium sp. 15x6]|uniref:3-oxoacyl-ACP reductase n=1 Tax=Polyangium sp. 15x6 TaxID=3042687 RepID=UPI00249B7FEA|nr:3-oxoacyl-ACP reductase [Polyangium sp. 15x6]MDI3282932.1 3-oxoacyl-ACP reductase [Polyangium sp. 15x6]
MSDVLLEIGRNARARAVVSALGLPIPLPVPLRRARGPWRERPLADASVVVGASAGAELAPVIAETLAAAGANAYLTGTDSIASAFVEPGEAYGRPARPFSALGDNERVAGVVFDATGLRDVAGLRALYETFHPLVSRLARSGRVLVLGRPSGNGPAAAAAQAALEGFVRSVAKEIGRGGATANLVRVEKGAEARLGPVLRFLLSPRSAFVSAQPFVVDARTKMSDDKPPFVRPLEKKVAVVTGAARGIGAATARRLAEEGAHVVCLDRPGDDGPTSQLARSIQGTALLVDLGADDAPARIAEVVRGLGGLDVVVHNAGITRDKTLGRMSEKQWDEVIGVNLGAVVRTHEALEPLMREGGRVVCLSSIAGIAGNVGQSAYAASKAGILGFVAGLAPIVAERGITVNAVAPGFIETRLTAAIPVAVREAGRRLAALGQGGLPEDVAEVITFLASPGAAGITGRTVRVCGGALIGA